MFDDFDSDEFKKVVLPKNGCILFIPKEKLVETIKQSNKEVPSNMKDGGTLCFDLIDVMVSIHVEIDVYKGK